MRDINDKLLQIVELIKEVGKVDEGVENILMDGFSLSLRTIQQVIAKKDKEAFDVDERLELVTKALGFPLEDLVSNLVARKQAEMQAQMMAMSGQSQGKFDPNKKADEDVLNFIMDNSTFDDKVLNVDAKDQNDDDIRNIVNIAESQSTENEKSVDDYQKFLNKAREDLSFLKTQI